MFFSLFCDRYSYWPSCIVHVTFRSISYDLDHRHLLCDLLGLFHFQCIYLLLIQGPGGVWCDVDVVEFSYFGAPEPTPKEQLYTALVDDLRGSDPCIGSGSQVYPVSIIFRGLSLS